MASLVRRATGALRIFGLVLAAALLVPQASSGATTNVVQGIDLKDGGNVLKVTIRTASRPDSTAYKVSDPSRIVVEIRSSRPGDVPPVLDVNNGTLVQVRTDQVDSASGPMTRVVLYLDRAKEFVASSDDSGVKVEIVKGSGAGAGGSDPIASAISTGGASEAGRFDANQLSSVQGDHVFPGYAGTVNRILGVDFKNRPGDEDVSQIVITADRDVHLSQSRNGERQLVFQIEGAQLGTGLERALDTTQFASAIDRVTFYQDRRRKDQVRVVVDLRESVQPVLSRGGRDGEIVTVEFPIPPAIAASQAAAPQAVAPTETTPMQPAAAPSRAESATGREKLVSGGAALDPAEALKPATGLFGSPDGTILDASKSSWTGRRMNIDLVNADIHNVFRLISNVSRLNIVTSDQVQGTVTVRLIDVPWDQALAAILQAKGMGASQFGNIIRVAPLDVIRMEKETALQAQRATKELLPMSVLTLPLNYAQASDMKLQVKAVLSTRGNVEVDERSNTIIVNDVQEALQRARELVLSLDTQTPQVLIEARIVEANDSFSRQLGIQWGGNLNFNPDTGAPTGLYFPNTIGVSGGQTTGLLSGDGTSALAQGASTYTTTPSWVVDLPATSSAGSLAIALGAINNVIGLDARLSAIEAAGEGRIISSPRVMASTNKPATIQQGSRIPYITSSLRGTQTQFAEATLKLQVTPQVTADRNVILDVQLTKNSADFGRTVAGLPTIEVKEAATTALVRDGETAVIGGVYSVDDSVNRTYVPGLGEIPILGALFKTTATNHSRKEMLVFITPTILTRSLPRGISLDVTEGTTSGTR